MEASPEEENCQEGGGKARKMGEKAAFIGQKRPFFGKKGSFFGVCVYWIINRKKNYLIDIMCLTRNKRPKQHKGWVVFTMSSGPLQGSVTSGQ
jgi:hypothetical protein